MSLRLPIAASALALCIAAPLAAQNSAPVATAPMADTIPAAVDQPYPGTMTLAVDARDVGQGIVRVEQTIPVASAGPMVILYPKWLPGTHAPEGEAVNLAGLSFTAGGKAIGWRRDPLDMYAFHIDVPAGAREVKASFQYLSAGDPSNNERVVMTPAMMNLQWEKMSLYPAGYYTRQIPVTLTARYPNGWTAYTALRGKIANGRTTYETVPYETLVDSPVFAGLHAQSIVIGKNVKLNIVGDTAASIALTDEQVEFHKNLVVQADKLFGARHYDHYDFLLAVSDKMSGIGLEHHRSSENAVGASLFSDWPGAVADRDLLPHEYVHSWNGKFRRPADLWTPDYRTPMRDSLLWVYEGLTTFYGPVLAARSGLWSKDEYLGYIANVTATYAAGQPGQSWRSLADTTNDPIVTLNGGVTEWSSWSRGYDYYSGASLVWLEADQLIRQRSKGARSLDDFARGFFGIRDGDWGTVTYTFDDIVSGLNAVEPYDWASFLRTRLERTSGAELGAGVGLGGYRLAYDDQLNAYAKAGDTIGLTYSLGMSLAKDGKLSNVLWDGPAFDAGLRSGDQIVALDGISFDGDALVEWVRASTTETAPIRLLVKSGDRYREIALPWRGGLRYPKLEPTGTGVRGIDRLLAPK